MNWILVRNVILFELRKVHENRKVWQTYLQIFITSSIFWKLLPRIFENISSTLSMTTTIYVVKLWMHWKTWKISTILIIRAARRIFLDRTLFPESASLVVLMFQISWAYLASNSRTSSVILGAQSASALVNNPQAHLSVWYSRRTRKKMHTYLKRAR